MLHQGGKRRHHPDRRQRRGFHRAAMDLRRLRPGREPGAPHWAKGFRELLLPAWTTDDRPEALPDHRGEEAHQQRRLGSGRQYTDEYRGYDGEPVRQRER